MKNNINIAKKNKIPFLIIYVTFSLLFILIAQVIPLYSTTTFVLAGLGPSIYFTEESWDFVEITPDELPTHIFKFKNEGDEVLIIKEIKVSCESCIDAVISTKELGPGEEGELEITVNSLDMTGRFTKRIYLESNDPVNPQTIIAVSGFIKEKDKPAEQIQPQPQTQTPFRVGLSYFNQREYSQAIAEFEKSIELDSNHADSYYYLGQCYLQMGIIEYNKKHILKAYSLYRKANKVAEQVIPLYIKNIEDNPEDLDTFLKLGYIYEIKSIIPYINEHNEALDYYLGALNLDNVSQDKNIEIYLYLNTRIGLINYQEKNYPLAIEYLENAEKISSKKSSAVVYYYLGKSYDKMDEKEKALNSFSRVIEIAPQSEFAREAEKELKKLNK